MINKYTKTILVILTIICGVTIIATPMKAIAATPAGCIYDTNAKLQITGSSNFSTSSCTQFLSNSNPPTGSYWLIVDKRVSDNPCKDTTQDSTITQARFNQIKSNPSSYQIQSKPNCGTPQDLSVNNTAPCTDTRNDVTVGQICTPVDTAVDKCTTFTDKNNACGFFGYIQDFINFLAVAVGLIAVIMIIIGGIQYSQSAGDPQKVAAAKKRLFNAVFALVAFGLLYGVLTWLIPGGVLGG